MARCYLTGVRFPLDKGYVINRREARELIVAMTERLASLRRLLDQLGPLGSPRAHETDPQRADGGDRRRHRLVCKAMADTLSAAYPEIDLFLIWPEYRARVRSILDSGIENRRRNERVPSRKSSGSPAERASTVTRRPETTPSPQRPTVPAAGTSHEPQ